MTELKEKIKSLESVNDLHCQQARIDYNKIQRLVKENKRLNKELEKHSIAWILFGLIASVAFVLSAWTK